MPRILLSVLYIIVAVFSCYLQIVLLAPHRGQAMGMPFIISGAIAIMLIIAFTVVAVSDSFIKKTWLRIVAVLLQTSVVIYTIYKAKYYYNFIHNWSKDEFEDMSDYYPPGNENFWIIGIFSFLIIGYFTYKLLKSKRELPSE